MDPNADMCKSLVKWLQKIVPNRTRNLAEVCDGVAILDALIQISPEYFNKLESKIKRDVSSNNWRLRISNLRKILEAIIEYYQDVLTLQIADEGRPDVVKIGENYDPVQLAKLLRLLLGCAINCDNKQAYITMIMQMEESIQQNIMQVIQELEEVTVGPGRSGLSLLILDSDTRITKLLNDLETSNKTKEALTHQVLQLEQHIQSLLDDKQALVEQNQGLLEKEARNPQDSVRKQMDLIKEELFRAEVVRDDFKAKVHEQAKEILVYQDKISELQLAANDSARLKDEVDALTESASKVADLELALGSYKKRLENYQDVKRNLQKLEDKNMEYLQKNLELEEEVSKNKSWKTQCDAYKNKVFDLQQKLDDESQRADKSQFNLEKMKSKMLALQGEKERLALERDYLRDENEALKLGSKREKGAVMSQELTPADVKEKLRFLEKENQSLKNSSQELESKQVQLENALSRLEKLQQKNRTLNQTILKLETQVEEMKSEQQCPSNSSVVKEYNQKIISLQEALRTKENDLQVVQSKYNRNLEKARQIAEQLNFKLDDDASRQVLKDLDGKLTAAFHKLSMNCNRIAMEDRINNSQTQSINSQQRSATSSQTQRFKSK